MPKFSDRLKLEENATRTIAFTAGELETLREKAENASLSTESLRARHAFSSLRTLIDETLKKRSGVAAIPVSVRLYQLKITLRNIEPAIWRRIQIRDCVLERLHSHIQTSMGWKNSHLYNFKIDGERYSEPSYAMFGDEPVSTLDSTSVQISDIVPTSGKPFMFEYQYDFGDSWYHDILFEGCLTSKKGHRYPICVEGERCCPPEDVGDVSGYRRFLDIIMDPKDGRRVDLLRWSEKFDPEKFDKDFATRRMQRGIKSFEQHVLDQQDKKDWS